jgi:hypothetical protein
VDLKNSNRAGITWHIEGNKAQGLTFYPNENRITIGEIRHVNRLWANTIINNIFDDFTKEGFIDEKFNLRIMNRVHMVEVYINNKFIFATNMLGTPQKGKVGYWSDEGEITINDLKIYATEELE